jgi:dATP pyrophosphohydrolase
MTVPLRSDIIDVYIFRRSLGPARYQFLQLLRSEDPFKGTWHPIMGHMHEGETALQAAHRELAEEVSLLPSSPDCLRFFALEQVHPYFIPELNCIVLSPRFATEVGVGWSPTLNPEHSDFRWIDASETHLFMWPGQRACIAEILDP